MFRPSALSPVAAAAMTSQTQSLSARLTSLSESNKATVQLINKLARLTFTPGAAPQDGDAADTRAELSSDIHEGLKQQEEE
ncbi:MAG: hypothetical protein INR71_13170, partial [Terriglobus roseus]|nr:hypothetical protein [Terriglobus roseus]